MREVPAEMAAKLEAASNSFVASFDDLHMNDIAVAAGVSRSSLYYYFAGKDDVLGFLLRSLVDELAESSLAASTVAGDSSTRLRAVIRAQLESLNAHPTTSQLLITNLGRAGKLPDIATRVREGFHDPVRRLLAEGEADGTFRALADTELAATALFGAILVIGLEALVLHGGIDVDAVIDSIGPMFWFGIAPSADTPQPSRKKPSRR
ncbi:MAG: TetR/AcrR family transcriptional regulator [Acidimicrobiales bacterium]|nr:TetR/AcrR family transcriptional regulator [Acidimicrobiales bacterium]